MKVTTLLAAAEATCLATLSAISLALPDTKVSKVSLRSSAEPERALARVPLAGWLVTSAGTVRTSAMLAGASVSVAEGSCELTSLGRAWPLMRTVRCSRPMDWSSAVNASRIFST